MSPTTRTALNEAAVMVTADLGDDGDLVVDVAFRTADPASLALVLSMFCTVLLRALADATGTDPASAWQRMAVAVARDAGAA